MSERERAVEWRQVSGDVAHRTRPFEERGLRCRDGIKIAHETNLAALAYEVDYLVGAYE